MNIQDILGQIGQKVGQGFQALGTFFNPPRPTPPPINQVRLAPPPKPVQPPNVGQMFSQLGTNLHNFSYNPHDLNPVRPNQPVYPFRELRGALQNPGGAVQATAQGILGPEGIQNLDPSVGAAAQGILKFSPKAAATVAGLFAGIQGAAGENPKNIAMSVPLTFLAGGVREANPEQVANVAKLAGDVSKGTTDYLSQLSKDQKAAAETAQGSLGDRVGAFFSNLKRGLYSSEEPIRSPFNQLDQNKNVSVIPSRDLRNQLAMVRGSDAPAEEFMRTSGLDRAIQVAPDEHALGQYLIAKHAPELESLGISTGRDAAKDKKLVRDLGPTYEPLAQQIYAHSQALLDYMVQAGTLAPKVRETLRTKYPNYVPFNRIFNEDELARPGNFVTKALASLSKQNVVKKIKGSEREIQDPLGNLVDQTYRAFQEGEKNKAAQILSDTRFLPDNPLQITPVKEVNGKNTFSVLRNGVKEMYQTTPEVAVAAKNLSAEPLNMLIQIAGVPARITRLFATGINPTFIARNLGKDQLSLAINTDKVLKTSIANPLNFFGAILHVVKRDATFHQAVARAGIRTSYSYLRENPEKSIASIRSFRSKGARAQYVVTHPGELLRAIEDTVGTTEQSTRLQAYTGIKDYYLKQGYPQKEAEILAAKAGREGTVDFSQHGAWVKTANYLVPYLNAGLQGGRTFSRNLTQRPIQTSLKIATLVLLPTAAVAAWNMSDPKRRAAYDDIQDFEKQNNWVIIPPDPVKDPNTNTWNVIKVPISQELTGLTNMMTKLMEGAQESDPVGFQDIANAFTQSTTGLNAESPNQILSQLTPQIAKVPIEMTTNTNLFTGKQIVPDEMQNLPANEQAYPNTSGTARILGGITGISPIQVQNAVGTAGASLGKQLLATSDQLLAAAGAIPPEQSTGKNPIQSIGSAFTEAAGGKQVSLAKEQVLKSLSPQELAAYKFLTSKQLASDEPRDLNNPAYTQARASVIIDRPAALLALAKVALAYAGGDPNKIDPLYKYALSGQNGLLAALVYEKYETIDPNDKTAKSDRIESFPWITTLSKERSAFFQQNPVPASPVANIPYAGPQASPQIQAKLDFYNTLPKNTGDRTAFLQQNPDVLQYFNQVNAFNNYRASFLPGVPMRDAFGNSINPVTGVLLGGSGIKKSSGIKASTIKRKIRYVKAKQGKTRSISTLFKVPKTKQYKVSSFFPKKGSKKSKINI